MKKSLSLLTALALLCALTAPALGVEAPEGRCPDLFAAFDADAWFRGAYAGESGLTKAQYMARAGERTDDAFRRDMFADWEESAAVGGRFRLLPGAPVVTVDGVPILFEEKLRDGGCLPAIDPELGAIMVPLPAMEKAMGFQTVRSGEFLGTFTVTRGEWSARFDYGGDTYTVTHGGVEETRPLNAPAPISMPNATYLPLRPLVEGLGCAVEWVSAMTTAAVTTIPVSTLDYDPPLWQRPYTYDQSFSSREEFMAFFRLSTEQDYYDYVALSMAAAADYDEFRQSGSSSGAPLPRRYLDLWLEQHGGEDGGFDPLAWYLGQNDPWSHVYSDYVPEAWPPANPTQEDDDFYYSMLYHHAQRQDRIADERWDWERFLKERPDVAEAFLIDMEHPDRLVETSFSNYLTPGDYLAQHTADTLEQAYWGVYYDNWSGSRYSAMDRYWAFRADHPGTCADTAVTVDGETLYVPYGYSAVTIGGVVYAPAAALSAALGGEVGGDAHGYAELLPAAEAAGYAVAEDRDAGVIRLTKI